jgi:hypothetical protein
MKKYQFTILTTARDEEEARQIQEGLKTMLQPSYRKELLKLGTVGECLNVLQELTDKLKTKK